ncbi:MAG: EAL domain-containing protein [Lysobacteraceae bacterium]
MIQNNPSPQEEYRQSFLRHLVNRLEAVEQRIQRFRCEGWDLSALKLLHDDVQRLAGSSGRYDLMVPSQRLLLLEQAIGDQLTWMRLPDPQQGDRILALIVSVKTALEALPDYQKLFPKAAPAISPSPVADIPTAGTVDKEVPQAAPATGETAKPAAFGWTAPRVVMLLSDGNAFAMDLAQRLKNEGFDIANIDTAGELSDQLKALSPEMLLVDASRIADLPVVDVARREALQRSADKDARIRLVALGEQDNLQTRLQARRAGVDILLFPPFNAAEVLRRVHGQLAPPSEDAMRVLIVEDDRSQAQFAQSVLVNAGMQAQIELDTLHVLDALNGFQPDLILMDLHMPEADGVELTALIRDHEAFMDTPIVFLTGDNDPDARSEAINAGGDDFLYKPISPKALIAAVQGRVRRRRAVVKRDRLAGARDERTGLYQRAWLFDRINDAIGAASDQRSQVGGVLFLEIEDAAALRDRFGLVAVESLLAAAGGLLSDAVGDRHLAALINDNAFAVLATDLDDDALDALARHLRDTLSKHYFEEGGKPVKLVPSVGICPLRYGFDDASALINTAERTCRDARVGEHGIRIYDRRRIGESDPDASLARQIRDAVGSDGFGLIYQPIAAIQGGHQAQYQTLLRLSDADGRLVSAAEILPLAERAGLMIDIDRWVLSRAMSVLAQQRDNGRHVRLFVPQALTTLAAKDQDIFLKVELGAHELSGGSLVLECRLADALLNPPALIAFADSMRSNGVQLCLGQYEQTADASALLEKLPLGFIKLAHKYVEDNVSKPLRDELRTICEQAHGKGIQVIGHRVEDQQTAMILRMYGVDYIQGNFVQGANDELAFDFNAELV